MGWIILGFIVLMVVGVIGWVILAYNSLVSLEERISNAQAQIATQVESRWDALVALTQTVKQYSSHEANTLISAVEQRRSKGRNSTKQDLELDEATFDQAKLSIHAVAEQYPDLKASSIYQQFMQDVNQYERSVRESRMIYNDSVTKFNRQIKVLPTVFIARMMSLSEKTYFKESKGKSNHPMTSQVGE